MKNEKLWYPPLGMIEKAGFAVPADTQRRFS